MFKRQFALALVFGMAATAPPAVAQQLRCADREMVTNRLQENYREHQSGLGLQSDNKLVEIWTSSETGTWTILMTLPNGMTCVMATGENWLEEMPRPTMAGRGTPS